MSLDFLEKEKLHTGFGEKIVNAKSYEDVLEQAGLNWTVEAHPAFADVNGKQIAIPGSKVIVRLEDEKPLGIVSDRYKIVQNVDAFDFTKSLFDGEDIEFVRGGSYKGGSSTWLETKITGKFSILGDDTDCYLIFKNSHDGTGSVICMIVPERIACSNALNFPLKNAARHWRCVHSGNPLEKINEAKEVLLAGSSYMNAIQREAEVLQSIKLSDTQVISFINRLFPITNEMTDRTKENRNIKRAQLLEVFLSKDDLSNFGSTGFKFISAVADYVDHVSGKNTTNGSLNRFMNVAYGSPLVDTAYNMVLEA